MSSSTVLCQLLNGDMTVQVRYAFGWRAVFLAISGDMTPATLDLEEPRADHPDFLFRSSAPGRACRSKRSVKI
jgi:hypothetical protein